MPTIEEFFLFLGATLFLVGMVASTVYRVCCHCGKKKKKPPDSF
jgi:hypothetical protein